MPNRLAQESSAYLLQHQYNPVDWHPWSEDAWERARREDKPVLVSIGYSSCHWCHVMERESFENTAIAALMNERLVCIKVDREERPDVDQIYMDTVVRLTGSGGWPLNVFCAPDGRPYWGGTYFPPQRMQNHPAWPEVVDAVTRFYREKPEELETQATQILTALRARAELAPEQAPGVEELGTLCRELMGTADRSHGGFGAAPKFPTPTNLEAILLASTLRASPGDARDHVAFSLKRMSRGGLFDQLGGGFHRYSTDARWLVPHFEKMLYDQGQLLRVFAETYRQEPDPDLRWPVEETVDWLEREMRSPEGGFYASQDADSEGEEGRFYVWSPDEIAGVLTSVDAEAFCAAYSVVPGGTFERTGKSVLEHALAGERPRFAPQRRALLEARQKRVAPDTDRKHIAAWIAYAVGGLAAAASSMGRDDWRDAAVRAADFVTTRLSDPSVPGGLLRIWDGSGARVPAFLDDHAAWLCALLDLHRAGAGERFAEQAIVVANCIRERFYDTEARALFFTAGDDATLPFRPESDSDGATPAAAGLAALGLVRASALSGRTDLANVAQAVLEAQGAIARRVPAAVPTSLRAAALLERGPAAGIVLGDATSPATEALAQRARALLSLEDPVVVLTPGDAPAWLDPELLDGRTDAPAPTAFLCRGRVCSLPASAPEELQLPPQEDA